MAAGEYLLLCMYFFFQAEDGKRDWCVTGVQTCALPICPFQFRPKAGPGRLPAPPEIPACPSPPPPTERQDSWDCSMSFPRGKDRHNHGRARHGAHTTHTSDTHGDRKHPLLTSRSGALRLPPLSNAQPSVLLLWCPQFTATPGSSPNHTVIG